MSTRYADIVGAGWGPGPYFGVDAPAGPEPGALYYGGSSYTPPAPVNSPAVALGPGAGGLALRKPLALRTKCIEAGQCGTTEAVPQEVFKPQLFILPKRVAIACSISDIRAGIQPIFASSDGDVPGEAFLAEAENVAFNGWTVLPNQPLFVTFRNESDQPLTVKGAFWGWVVSGNMLHLYGPHLSAQTF